jgi:hypothetical protein
MRNAEEVYLGDGLYASHDGFQIILRAPRMGGDHYVALEPQVYRALVSFVENCTKKEKSHETVRG